MCKTGVVKPTAGGQSKVLSYILKVPSEKLCWISD